MKFEEVLPTLREGRKIRRKSWGRVHSFIIIKDDSLVDDYRCNVVIYAYDLKADDWEIVTEKKKVKLRDLTAEQVKKWIGENCNRGDYCKDCPFRCIECYDTFWLSCKDMFSDKFLDQEIEVEQDD